MSFNKLLSIKQLASNLPAKIAVSLVIVMKSYSLRSLPQDAHDVLDVQMPGNGLKVAKISQRKILYTSFIYIAILVSVLCCVEQQRIWTNHGQRGRDRDSTNHEATR